MERGLAAFPAHRRQLKLRFGIKTAPTVSTRRGLGSGFTSLGRASKPTENSPDTAGLGSGHRLAAPCCTLAAVSDCSACFISIVVIFYNATGAG